MFTLKSLKIDIAKQYSNLYIKMHHVTCKTLNRLMKWIVSSKKQNSSYLYSSDYQLHTNRSQTFLVWVDSKLSSLIFQCHSSDFLQNPLFCQVEKILWISKFFWIVTRNLWQPFGCCTYHHVFFVFIEFFDRKYTTVGYSIAESAFTFPVWTIP